MFNKNRKFLFLLLALFFYTIDAQTNTTIPPNLEPIVIENAMQVMEFGDPFYQAENGYTRVVKFSHDSTMLFAGYWFSEHVLFSLSSIESITRIALEIPVCDAVFSPDDSLVVISDLDGNIYVYDVSSMNQIFTANKYVTIPDTGQNCPTVAFNDSVMAYIDNDLVYLWDYKLRLESERLQMSGDSLLFSLDGTLLAITSEIGNLSIWDTSTRDHVITLTGQGTRINSLAFNDTGTQLISAYEESDSGRAGLIVWDLDDGITVNSISGENTDDEILDFVISDTGSILAIRGTSTITLWNMTEWMQSARFPEFTRPTDLAFSIDNSLIIFTTLGASVEIWDFSVDRIYTHILAQERPCEGWVNSLDLSGDGQLIAAGDECGTVRLFGVAR